MQLFCGKNRTPYLQFHHISCPDCSQWSTPPFGSSFPRQGSSTSLRSFVSCTGWRLQSGLHSNSQSSCTSVYTGSHLHTFWRALSGGRCRGLSATPFQFIFIIDCQPHPTPYVGDRAFPVAAARVWNSLPDPVTSAPSVAVFRSRLKTHLFNISYPRGCKVPAQWH